MKKTVLLVAAAALSLAATFIANAQTYSNTVISLSPVGYWPLNEGTPPPQPINLTAQNLGSLGAAGNGYYGAWYQPSGTTWYLTNNIVQAPAVTYTNDGSMGMLCQGAPGQYVIVPRNTNCVANAGVTLNPPFSIEAWLKIGTTVSALGDIISQGATVNLNVGGPNTNNPYYGGLGSGWAGVELGQYQDYIFLLTQSTNAVGNKASELDTSGYNQHKGFQVGQWVHVVATFDGSTETIWTNGAVCVSKTSPANGIGQKYVADPTTPLMIGCGSDVTASYGQGYEGTIDDVAIYTNVLSQTSIQNHFQAAYTTNSTFPNYTNAVLADHPVLYYRLNDPQVQTNAGYPSVSFPVANNYGSVGAAGNGVYQPGTTPGVAGPAFAGFGANSKSVSFNGWLGGVDVGGGNLPSSLNPTNITPLSVVTWFQSGPADAPGRFQEMLGHGDSSYRMALGQVAGEDHFNAGPGPELQFTTAASVATNGFAFNDGKWHMEAGVSDGTNEYMYLDGVLAQSNNTPTGINIAGNTNDLLIGGDSEYTYASFGAASTVRTFDGQVAQVAFWTNALSTAQVQSLFNAAEVPPYIWHQPVSVAINAGQNLTDTANARGSGTLTYQWYQNGLAVAGQTNAALMYLPVATNNAGNYFMVVSNSYGAATSAVVNLTIFGPPVITAQTPTNVEVFSGTSPKLRVLANGATLSYQWSLNGTPILGGTNSTYTLTNIASGGTYSCAVTNVLATNAIAPISVTVLADPTAPYPLQVLSNAPIDYYRLDESPGSLTAYDYAGGNNGIYTNVNLGFYSYTSGNTVQSDPNETSAGFGFIPSVNPNNDYAGNVPSYVNFGTPNGSNAEFTVEAWIQEFEYNGVGDCIIGVGYGGGEEFVLDTGAGSAGDLRFFVRNAAGTVSAASSSAQLANDNTWHHVVGVCDEAGGHIYLYLDGNLLASAAISANSGLLAATTPLNIGARESADNGLTNFDDQFAGLIDDVSVYNKPLTAAQVQADYYASGIAPFNLQIQPATLTTNQGSTISFTTSVSGTAPLAYQWYDNNNNPISGQTNSTLALTNVQQGQSGYYSVTVTNLYGSLSTNVSLTVVLGAPQINVNIQPTNVEAYAGDPVGFTLQVVGSQPLHYQWYQDNGAILSATNATYDFAALLGTNTYYCMVTNSFGSTNSSIGTAVGVAISTVNPTNFNSHLKITLAGYTGSEALSYFPVLVRLSTNVPGFSYSEFASPSGSDLRFTDSSGTRELAYEIDQWDDTNGVSSVWVQVPILSSTNTVIWAYWGDSGATTPPAYTTNGAVWVPPAFLQLPPYDVVYHLKESGFPYFDSTLNYPATNGVAPLLDSGIVGNSELFANSNYLDSGTVNLGNAFTISSWVNVNTNAGSCQTICANQHGGYGMAGFSLFINFYGSTNLAVLFDSGDGTGGSELSTAPGVVSGGWHLISAAVGRTNQNLSVYVDGVATPIVSGNPLVSDFANDADLNFGSFTNNSLYFNGDMDEARIHAGIEDSNWVYASYLTVASNNVFSAYSSVTNSVLPPVQIMIRLSNGQVILNWPQGTLQSAGQVTGPYTNVPSATAPYTNTVSGSQFYRVLVQ